MAPLSHGKHSYCYRELETKTPGLREGKRGTFRAVVSDIQSMAYVLAISNKLFPLFLFLLYTLGISFCIRTYGHTGYMYIYIYILYIIYIMTYKFIITVFWLSYIVLRQLYRGIVE